MPDYPLWCVDTGDEESEDRYRGPFDTFDEAKAVFREPTGEWTIRRCRSVLPSECPTAVDAEWILDAMDEHLGEGVLAGSWADWENPLTEPVDDFEAKLWKFIDENVKTRVYVCEGDE